MQLGETGKSYRAALRCSRQKGTLATSLSLLLQAGCRVHNGTFSYKGCKWSKDVACGDAERCSTSGGSCTRSTIVGKRKRTWKEQEKTREKAKRTRRKGEPKASSSFQVLCVPALLPKSEGGKETAAAPTRSPM